MTTWLPYVGCAVLALYLLVVLAFIVAGKRTDARALVGFVPDCVILFSRLLRDSRVPRRSKVFVAALIPYLALPFDLIPDFIPVAGQADDAILVALVLRILVKRTEPVVLRELWPGPDASLRVVFMLAGYDWSHGEDIGLLHRPSQAVVSLDRDAVRSGLARLAAEHPTLRVEAHADREPARKDVECQR